MSFLMEMGSLQLVGTVAAVSVTMLGLAFAYVQRPSSRKAIPAKMKAARLTKFVKDIKSDVSSNFEVAELDTPVPRPGQVLVKIERSPINPSDLSSLGGSYNAEQREALPAQMGFEASGTVVQSGGGFFGWRVNGKRVACVSKGGGRMWAEYAVVPAVQAIPLPDKATFEQGCSCFVNPLTAIAFVEIAQAKKQRAILHTAGASALGQMLVRFARRNGIEVIAVVRRAGNRDTLAKIGCKRIVVTADEDWEAQLKKHCEETNCRIGFDAVAGPQVGTLLKCMPKRSTLHVYGGLSNQACGTVRPTELIFRGSTVTGFWLTAYLRTKGLLGLKKMTDTVVSRITDDLESEVNKSFPLEDVSKAVTFYANNMSAGKILIAPSMSD